MVTHWQSLYSNGSRQGLAGLDEVASRLARTFGPRLLWMTNGQIARYRVATRPLIAVYPRAAVVPQKVQLFVDFMREWAQRHDINHGTNHVPLHGRRMTG